MINGRRASQEEDVPIFFRFTAAAHLSWESAAVVRTNPEVDAVAQFLEVLNSLMNIENAIKTETRALYIANNQRHKNLKNLLEFAYAETEDAYQVLDKVPEHIEAVNSLKKAGKYLKRAKKFSAYPLQRKLIKKAMYQQRAARNSMCVSGSDQVLCQEN